MSRPIATDLVLWNRLFKQVAFVLEGCWEWQGAANKKTGYGVINWRGETRYTHRVAWEFWCGLIPDGLFVCHGCDNRKCMRPDHLFLGTNQDNIDDMVQKGRQKKETFVTFDGLTLHLAEWSRRVDLLPSTISNRIRSGWSVEKALTVPVRSENHSIYMVKT